MRNLIKTIWIITEWSKIGRSIELVLSKMEEAKGQGNALGNLIRSRAFMRNGFEIDGGGCGAE